VGKRRAQSIMEDNVMKNKTIPVFLVIMLLGAAVVRSQSFSGAQLNGVNLSDKSSVIYAISRSLPTYGKYCGPAWSNGEWVKDRAALAVCNGTSLVEPADAIDALCKQHDFAYCSTDAKVQDEADHALIKGLKAERPAIVAKFKAQNCQSESYKITNMVSNKCASSGIESSAPGTCAKITDLVAKGVDKVDTRRFKTSSVAAAKPAEAPVPEKPESESLVMQKGTKPASGPNKQGGNGIVKMGSEETKGPVLKPVKDEPSESCHALNMKLGYADAAIALLSAKRILYEKSQNGTIPGWSLNDARED